MITVSSSIRNDIIQIWQDHSALRFATSGILGNAVFFGLDILLYPVIVRLAANYQYLTPPVSITSLATAASSPSPSLLSSKRRVLGNVATWVDENAASVSFFVAYLMDIVVQHFLNAWLVFGLDTIRTRELYLSSLGTAYTAYFGTLCGSTILQSYLLQIGFSKNVAFWLTIGLGSIVNYTVLTALSKRSKSNAKSTDEISIVLNNTESTKIGNKITGRSFANTSSSSRRRKSPPIAMVPSHGKCLLEQCYDSEELNTIQKCCNIFRQQVASFLQISHQRNAKLFV